jgi:hypothetical protein
VSTGFDDMDLVELEKVLNSPTLRSEWLANLPPKPLHQQVIGVIQWLATPSQVIADQHSLDVDDVDRAKGMAAEIAIGALRDHGR